MSLVITDWTEGETAPCFATGMMRMIWRDARREGRDQERKAGDGRRKTAAQEEQQDHEEER
ncbi:MAG: hypothetical protein JO174_13265 [Herbaspirillum sp.]|nr:hypothetical protein [Herbaspirillum sp.]